MPPTNNKLKRNTSRPRKIPVEFTYTAPQAAAVHLVGDFTAWEARPQPLTRNNDGVWEARIPLSPGRYEYWLLVDGQWQNDPACPACVENAFGTVNNVIELK